MKAALNALMLAGAFLAGAWIGDARVQIKQHEAITASMQDTLDAVQVWQADQLKQQKDYEELEKVVRDMRSTVSGLRLDVKGFNARASEAQLRAYTDACTAVFNNLATEVGELVEAGADIARKADQHAADARLSTP